MRNIVIVFLILIFNGCSNMNLSDYKDKKPLLKLEEYFKGKTIARGVFEDRFGNIKKVLKYSLTELGMVNF